MAGLSRAVRQGLVGLCFCFVGLQPGLATDWQPITAEDLALRGEPKAPGAPAIFLYRQVDRDDNEPMEAVYSRIKILTEEGRKYADVQIPYDKHTERVSSIEARAVRPDGTIVKFDGTVYEKPLARSQGAEWLAKTFTMPDVQVGGIVEYRYRHSLRSGFVYDSHWVLSQELFTKTAKFSLQAYRGFRLLYSWPNGLPPDTDPPADRHGAIRLDTHDLPAFATEDYMPPENELKYRVDFIYLSPGDLEPGKDPDVYWKKVGKKTYREVQRFVDKPRAMADAVAQIVAPGDSADVKLHKIYERVQRVRNTSFERHRTEAEVARENLKSINNVEDLWKLGYGDGNQLPWLFLGLVRAAGIPADPLIVGTRNSHFFNPRLMNAADLNSNVVVVTLDGKDWYLDPGTALAPFGLLPWSETAVRGLRLDDKGGSWVDIPLPEAQISRLERQAKLTLTPDGTLEGRVTVTYSGEEALSRRLDGRLDDEVDRKEYLERELQADIRTGSVVQLVNRPDWDSSAPTLVAEFDLKIPGWAEIVGRRALMPISVFGAVDQRTFVHGSRTHPIYFSFPYQNIDDVAVDLPVGWQWSTIPAAREERSNVAAYSVAADAKNGSFHMHRELLMNAMYVHAKYYGALHDFFQTVRAGDEQQVIAAPDKKLAGI